METAQAVGDVHAFWEIRSLGDLSSILAFVIAIINSFLIMWIRRNFLINATIRPLLVRLTQNSFSLNQCLAQFDASTDDFTESVGRCEANVQAVRRRLGIRKGWFCRELLRAVKIYHTQRDRNSAREVYNGLQKVIEHLYNLVEERGIIGS